jgi:hypothetical protein
MFSIRFGKKLSGGLLFSKRLFKDFGTWNEKSRI